MSEVRAYYGEWSPEMDEAIYKAAGRVSDFSGAGMGQRDHGWVCQSEIEAKRIEKSLKKIGIKTEIMP